MRKHPPPAEKRRAHRTPQIKRVVTVKWPQESSKENLITRHVWGRYITYPGGAPPGVIETGFARAVRNRKLWGS
jgi:hypothetical protein